MDEIDVDGIICESEKVADLVRDALVFCNLYLISFNGAFKCEGGKHLLDRLKDYPRDTNIRGVEPDGEGEYWIDVESMDTFSFENDDKAIKYVEDEYTDVEVYNLYRFNFNESKLVLIATEEGKME